MNKEEVSKYSEIIDELIKKEYGDYDDLKNIKKKLTKDKDLEEAYVNYLTRAYSEAKAMPYTKTLSENEKKHFDLTEITDEEKREIKKIQDHLDSDDTVLLVAKQATNIPGGAVITGGNTIYATNKKIIIRNPTMLGLRVSVEEIPYDQITSVKLEKGMFSSSVVIRSPGLSELSRLSQSSGLIAWGRGEEGQIDAIPKEKAEQLVRIIKEKMEHVKLSKNAPQISEEDPLKILKVRFAKGEITKEEYDEMKSVLE